MYFYDREEKELGLKIAKKFKGKDGPFFQVLELALSSLNVQRQVYQGGMFVGNRVYKSGGNVLCCSQPPIGTS